MRLDARAALLGRSFLEELVKNKFDHRGLEFMAQFPENLLLV